MPGGKLFGEMYTTFWGRLQNASIVWLHMLGGILEAAVAANQDGGTRKPLGNLLSSSRRDRTICPDQLGICWMGDWKEEGEDKEWIQT